MFIGAVEVEVTATVTVRPISNVGLGRVRVLRRYMLR